MKTTTQASTVVNHPTRQNPHYFVLAPAFHGATLLALLLSNHPDIVDLGDTNPPRPEIWCSCGHRLSDCPFWTSVLSAIPARRAAGGKMLPTVPDLTSSPAVNVWLSRLLSTTAILSSPSVWRLAGRRHTEYIRAWTAFSDAALLATGATLLVDGEKSVTKFLAFRSSRDVDVRLIHLTRDPRAFARSINRHRVDKALSPMTPSAVADTWSKGHRRILRASRGLADDRSLRVRYEDLAREPAAAMQRIFEFMGVEDHDVLCPPRNAHVFGNAMASTFNGEVRLDAAWETSLSLDEKERIAQQAEPLFSRLGYAHE